MTKAVRDAQGNLYDGTASFSKQFMTMDLATLRKNYKADQLVKECGKMSIEIDKLIEDLNKEISQIIRMHNSRK